MKSLSLFLLVILNVTGMSSKLLPSLIEEQTIC